MKRILSIVLLMTFVVSSFSFASVYAETYDDYRKVNWGEMGLNATKPTAGFSIVAPDGRDVPAPQGNDDSTLACYPGEILEVKLGDTISIVDESQDGSGSIDMYDFQVYWQKEQRSKQGYYSSLPTSWVMDREGIWDFYLCVRDNTTLTGGWTNWSENGSRRVPGPNGMLWYFAHVRVNVVPKDRPIADMAFSDTDSTIKYITVGESVTLVDKSYTLDGTSIIGWGIQDRGKPETYITNPDSFFGTRTFNAVGTYTIALPYVINSNGIRSTNPAKKLTVVVVPKPAPGQGKVNYEYYKDSLKEENILGTDEVGISNPFLVVFPDTYGDGLKFSSATYSGEAVSTGGSCKNGDTIAIANPSKNLLIQAVYKKGATGPSSDPPTAIINAPDTIMAGQSVKADGKRSHSNNIGGSIVAYYWDYEGANLVRNNGSNVNIWYPHEGTYTIFLNVEDEMGNTEWTDHEIKVTPPIPTAVITYTGKLKENRKITLDSSDSTSPTYYPIDTSKIVWQITPISGGAAADIKYEGVLNGNVSKDILLKKAGTYKVKLTVTNTYGRSSSAETTLTIQPDLPPIANIVLPAPEGMIYQVYREPSDENYATIEAYNDSSSPDGDIINKAIAFYCYDSDNDGNYKEEAWYYSNDGATWLPVNMPYDQMVSSFNIYNIATSNVPKWTLKSKEVGKYYFAIRVMETIPTEETIPAFITESDYKRADNFD